MGLAASQARMLMLFARKSDLEFQAEMNNNRRLALAYQSSRIARVYSDGIADRIIRIRTGAGVNDEVALTRANLTMVNLIPVYTADNSLVPNLPSDELEQGLRAGVIHLRYIVQPQDVVSNIVDWRTCTSLNDRLYTENDEIASAVYEAESARLQAEDKKLEMELKNIETIQKATDTEIDSVKKVIEKNIEKSFKIFA